MPKKLTTEQFIEKAREIHGDKYDYSKVNYVGSMFRVCIICPEHGEFWQTPNVHLSNHGCPICFFEKMKKDNTTFSNQIKKIHGENISINKNEYSGRRKKIKVKCNVCGNTWQTRPDVILSGCGCQRCFREKRKLTTEEFIDKARAVHGDKYNYSKVNYINANSKVCIICSEHGEFWQTPNNHISNKQGCPKCIEYKLEKEIKDLLLDNKINFETQKTFSWLKNKKSLRLDFYLPDYNIAIECQGEQHFKPIEPWGGEETYEYTINNDLLKKEFCKKHNIEIIYYGKNSEFCCTNTETVLKNIFRNY